MFFEADRIDLMRAMILSEDREERRQYLDRLFHFQKADMKALFEVMHDLPVTVRLLDPPLHEFLPHDEEDIRTLADRLGKPVAAVREAARNMAEVNPMLGFRGCRLSIVHPEITEMQVEAIIAAAIEARGEGFNPHPEIMIPLVINVREIRMITEIIERGILKAMAEKQVSIPYKIGTMMETPRACLGAKRLAPAVEFMSFGTNDLTQMTYGFSRDDVGKFIPAYLDKKLVEHDPFASLDQRAVGRLMKTAIEDSRERKKGIKYGICGEHGGDPVSIQFCHEIGLDYVSCSPFRVPVARIAAAQANVRKRTNSL